MSSKRNTYYCKVCGGAATKPACARKPGEKNPALATLGTWTCIKCGKGVKVRRESSDVAQAKKVAA